MNPITSYGPSPLFSTSPVATSDPTTAALTPEALLYYCSSRLASLDESIQQYFTEQQRRNAGVRDMSKLMEILQSSSWASGQKGWKEIKGDAFHTDNHAKKANEILEVWRNSDSPEARHQCAVAFRQVSGLDIDDFAHGNVTAADVQVAAAGKQIPEVDKATRDVQIEAIKNVQASMTKSAEMNMIQLQSLVSQRQLAVQLTTQLMQTMHETTKHVVGNIR